MCRDGVDAGRVPGGFRAGRKQLVIQVAPLDAASEEELEDVETPEYTRQKRWQRVQQAAVKQCLRCAPTPCCASSRHHQPCRLLGSANEAVPYAATSTARTDGLCNAF